MRFEPSVQGREVHIMKFTAFVTKWVTRFALTITLASLTQVLASSIAWAGDREGVGGQEIAIQRGVANAARSLVVTVSGDQDGIAGVPVSRGIIVAGDRDCVGGQRTPNWVTGPTATSVAGGLDGVGGQRVSSGLIELWLLLPPRP
jgi:hypothetical protein